MQQQNRFENLNFPMSSVAFTSIGTPLMTSEKILRVKMILTNYTWIVLGKQQARHLHSANHYR